MVSSSLKNRMKREGSEDDLVPGRFAGKENLVAIKWFVVRCQMCVDMCK